MGNNHPLPQHRKFRGLFEAFVERLASSTLARLRARLRARLLHTASGAFGASPPHSLWRLRRLTFESF